MAFYLRRFFKRCDRGVLRRETILDALYETHPPCDVRLRSPNIL